MSIFGIRFAPIAMVRAKKPKRTPSNPFWKRITPGEWAGIVLGVLAIFISAYFAYPSFVADSYEVEVLETKKEASPVSSADSGCGFPAHFVLDTLYVLITRFEDTPEEGVGNPYGKGIERRIDILSDSLQRRIVFCYRKDLSPNQRRDADVLRDKFHADLVIWGKLKNASSKCSTDGFCLQFEPSDSLITYSGGTVSTPKLDDYQFGISASNMETELIRMGNEIFDDWLIGMFNLKIGKQKPELFVIGEGWAKKKKAEGYLARGGIWDGLGHYIEAINDYNKVLKIYPKNIETYFRRGASNYRLGRHKDAIADFSQAINIDSSNATAYYNRGVALSGIGYEAKAIIDYNKSIKLNPNHVMTWINRGSSKSSLNQYAEAISDYNQVIALNPKNAIAYNNRGLVNFKLGYYHEAIADYDEAISCEPKFAAAYSNRGVLKSIMGYHDEAITDFERAIALAPSFSEYSKNLDYAYITQPKEDTTKWYICIAVLITILICLKIYTMIDRSLKPMSCPEIALHKTHIVKQWSGLKK